MCENTLGDNAIHLCLLSVQFETDANYGVLPFFFFDTNYGGPGGVLVLVKGSFQHTKAFEPCLCLLFHLIRPVLIRRTGGTLAAYLPLQLTARIGASVETPVSAGGISRISPCQNGPPSQKPKLAPSPSTHPQTKINQTPAPLTL